MKNADQGGKKKKKKQYKIYILNNIVLIGKLLKIDHFSEKKKMMEEGLYSKLKMVDF